MTDRETEETLLEAESRSLRLRRSMLGGQKLNISVKLTVTVQSDDTELSCTTEPKNIALKEMKLEMSLMRGQKRIRVTNSKRKLVLWVRTKLRPSALDVFEWTCSDDEGNECIDQDGSDENAEEQKPLVLTGKRQIVIYVSKLKRMANIYILCDTLERRFSRKYYEVDKCGGSR